MVIAATASKARMPYVVPQANPLTSMTTNSVRIPHTSASRPPGCYCVRNSETTRRREIRTQYPLILRVRLHSGGGGGSQ